MPPRAGHILTTSDFDVFGVTIFKTATESVTSSTTLQNDDQLFFAVVANARYTFDGIITYDGAAAGDLKVAFTYPALATFEWSNYGNTGPAAGTSVTDLNTVIQTNDARSLNALPTPSPPGLSFRPGGYLITGANAGTLQMQWAQDTSSATATRVRTGSWLRLVRAG